MYHADGIADAVTFKLTPGIRGPEHTHQPGYSCVDELTCNAETYFLCAQAHSTGKDVDFLACMDTSRFMESPASIAKTCATQGGLDWSAISTCFSGAEGAKLKKAASEEFDKKFPNPVGVPHIEVNGVAQEDRSESALIKALCATGIQAGACKKDIVV